MRVIVVAFAITLWALSVGAQSRSWVCPIKAVPDADVLLTVCTDETGMAALPPPRLHLRVRADGRAEYETGTFERQKHELVQREFRLEPDSLAELMRLARGSDMADVRAEYPAYVMFTDSGRKTTVVINDRGVVRRTLLNNFVADDASVQHYPRSLIKLMQLVDEIRNNAMGYPKPVPMISYCELFRNRNIYFGRRVRIYADFEYIRTVTRDLKTVHESEVLDDSSCDTTPMGETVYRRLAEVTYSGTADEIAALKAKTREIRGERFGGRARVLVTGYGDEVVDPMSRRRSLRFTIGGIEGIEPAVTPFQGIMRNGWTYSDTFDKAAGRDFALSAELKMRPHHAGRIEWENIQQFPQLLSAGRKFITFRVSVETVQQISPGRWNSVYRCTILEVR